MTKKTCIVAVDVGNSAVKLCVREEHKDGNSELRDHSIRINTDSWHRDAIDWVREFAGCQDIQWRIASVHRRAADDLERAIEDSSTTETTGKSAIRRITRRDISMPIRVDEPDRLGIDRLLGGFAAANRYGTPLVVVDAGSAVTVDWVDQNAAFCGGAILPGLRLQSEALASGTDALPDIQWHDTVIDRRPATNTVQAIQLGVLLGVAAAIDRLATEYQLFLPDTHKEIRLILTGGDSRTIAPYLRCKHQLTPNLVCRGLLDLQ